MANTPDDIVRKIVWFTDAEVTSYNSDGSVTTQPVTVRGRYGHSRMRRKVRSLDGIGPEFALRIIGHRRMLFEMSTDQFIMFADGRDFPLDN